MSSKKQKEVKPVFNNEYNEDDFEDELGLEDIDCQCPECSFDFTMELVDSFTNDILNASNVGDLQDSMIDLIERAKIQGIKEYIYESINDKMDILMGLDALSYVEKNIKDDIDFKLDSDNNIFNDVDKLLDENQSEFDEYGSTEIVHWKDRM